MRRTLVLLPLFLLAACGGGKVDTSAKLAEAMKKQGIAWETAREFRPEKLTKVIQDALELEGEGLSVEMFRIENEQHFKTAAMALAMRHSVEQTAEGAPETELSDSWVHHPFIVLVMEEPEPGMVREALGRVFPPGSDD